MQTDTGSSQRWSSKTHYPRLTSTQLSFRISVDVLQLSYQCFIYHRPVPTSETFSVPVVQHWFVVHYIAIDFSQSYNWKLVSHEYYCGIWCYFYEESQVDYIYFLSINVLLKEMCLVRLRRNDQFTFLLSPVPFCNVRTALVAVSKGIYWPLWL